MVINSEVAVPTQGGRGGGDGLCRFWCGGGEMAVECAESVWELLANAREGR